MKKLIVGALGVVGLVVLAYLLAPRAAGQASKRLPTGDFLPVGRESSLGVTVRDLNAEETKRAKLDRPSGAYLESIRDDSPASRAGLRSGDVVMEFDGEHVRSARHLTRLVQETPPDRSVKTTVIRDGSQRSVEVTLEARSLYGLDNLPDISRNLQRELPKLRNNLQFDFDGAPGLSGSGRLGVTLMPLSEQLASYFGVIHGVLVSQTEEGSPAARAGLKAGDVIVAIGSRDVDSPSDVNQVVRSTTRGADLSIRVMRDKKETNLTATLPVPESSRSRIRSRPV